MTRKSLCSAGKCFCIITLTMMAIGSRTMATQLSPGDRKLLCMDADMSEMLEVCASRGLLEIAPVALPEGEHLLGVNDHICHPVATISGDTIIVMYARNPSHWGGEDKPDEHTNYCVITRSQDGGKTWSGPVPITTFMEKRTKRCKAGFGNGFGTLPDGTVVCLVRYGVFRSRDQGATWEHLQGAFSEQQLKGLQTNMGPNLIVHPVYGLVAVGSHHAPRKKNNNKTIFEPRIWVRWSQDAGETWSEAKQDLPKFATPAEPTPFTHDGSMLVIARSHGKEALDTENQVWRYTQLYSRTGWLPFTPSLTNITASQVGIDKGHGPWAQDTVEVSFNPVSKRVEAVVTNRTGGGPGREHPANQQTINLWSIAPEELAEGSSEWRFEGTLLRRRKMRGMDGMHPGGGVIDAKNGVAHTFVYCGFRLGPSGIYRVTRSLDTPALSRQLQKLPVMTAPTLSRKQLGPAAKIKPCGLRMLFIHPATPADMKRDWYEPPVKGRFTDAASNYAPWFARLGLQVRHVHTLPQFLEAWAERTEFDVVTIGDHAWKRPTWLQRWFAKSGNELREYVRNGGTLVAEVGRDPQERPLAKLLGLNLERLPRVGKGEDIDAWIDVVKKTPFSRRLPDRIDTRNSDDSLVLSSYAEPLPAWARFTVCSKMDRPVVVAGHLGKGRIVAATAEILNPTNFAAGHAKSRFREEDLLQLWGNLLYWVGKEE